MKTVAIVQARMGSTRLPGKVLADVAGRPLLQRVIDRVSAARTVDEVVVATTIEQADDTVVAFVERDGRAGVVRGETSDVLARFVRAIDASKAEVVVRITADDPLKDPGIIDEVVERRCETRAHYCSNTLEPSFPEGLDVEVVTAGALRTAAAEATLPSDREHVTPFVHRQPTRFHLHAVRSVLDRRSWRWTVDTAADLAFVRAVFTHFRDRPRVPWTVVAEWLDEHPEVVAINAGAQERNAGYLRSLAEETG